MKKLLMLFTIFISANSYAVSFDCSKASTFSEKLVCSDKSLGELDDELAERYRDVLLANKELKIPADETKNEQKKWIKLTKSCTDRNCVKNSYEKRNEELMQEYRQLIQAVRYR